MAINDGFYWYKNVLKKQLKLALRIYLSIAIVLSPIFLMNVANAGAAESWTIEKVVYDNLGKNLSYTASRVNALASNDLVYKAKVPVTAAATGSTVASMIRLGLAGAAIYGIIEGVGWIIDNGVVKKYDKQAAEDENIQYQYIWYNENFTYDTCKIGQSYSTSSAAVQHIITCTKAYGSYVSTDFVDLNNVLVNFTRAGNNCCQTVVISKKANSKYDKDYEPPKLVPVSPSELGQQVIDSPQAPNLIPDIYSPNNPAGGAAPEATKKALEDANPKPRVDPKSDTTKKPNKDTDGDGQPDVYDPAEPDFGETTKWPEACSWFPTICEWYTKYKEDSDLVKEHREAEKDIWLKEDVAREEEKTAREEEKEQRKDEKTFWQKVEDWFDWAKDDSDLPEKENPEDIPDLDISADQVNLSGSNTCPQDSVSFSVMGKSVTLDMPYQPVCDALNFFKPAVLLVGAVASVYIVAGVRTKEEDQP